MKTDYKLTNITMEKDIKQKPISVFNAELQKETSHELNIADNGEILLVDIETGHTLKLPAGTDPNGLKAFVIAHKKANEGQLTRASIEENKSKLLQALT